MFQAKSFSPVSFSTQSFNMAQEANSGRSGYWRLFFYNMQEEALKADEQKQREGKTESKSPRAAEKPLEGTNVRLAPRLEPELKVEKIPVLPRPIYHRKQVELSWEPFAIMAGFGNELSSWSFLLPRLRDSLIIKQASNDDEEDVELLLLVA